MDSFTLNKIEFDAVRRILSEFCSSSLGRAAAMWTGPSRNPSVVQRWLRQTSQMLAAIRDKGLPPLAGVTDVTDALGRAHPGGGAGGEDFAAIASLLEAAGNTRTYLNSLGEEPVLLHELAKDIGDFEAEVKAIRSIVEPDGKVSDNASQRLAAIRKEIGDVAQHIRDVIYGYLHQPEVARLLQNVAVTLHEDRFVLPVKAENRGRLTGVVHRASNTGATVFVEPETCVELNNHLTELHDQERSEIQRLLNQLALRIQGRAIEIASTMRTLATVDLISAKAQYAYQNDMSCPEVSERGPLQFDEARHPLLIDRLHRQEKGGCPPEKRITVVPISLRLGQDFDLLVVTGSNTGGKTVALKTLALLTVMAQSGMHIPVQRGGTMPVFRDVYIDVGDEQSLQQSLSTFGAHVRRIKYILHKADRNCLVLFDELGSGTDPDEGGAIGQAVLDELREIGCLGMVTTHLSVLKAYAYTNPRVDNASVEFDTATLSPTYRLRIGTPGESHAIVVAAHLGLPKRVISQARKHLSEQGRRFHKAIAAVTAVRQEAEEARRQATDAALAARMQQETFEAKLADLHRLKDEFETALATLGELKPGDEVNVPSMKLRGKLARLELHRQVAVIDAGNLQVEVPLREMIPDFGQNELRQQIAAMRKGILDQARQTEKALADAARVRDEYRTSLQQQQERARQFDTWLGAIARVKVGDEVPIAVHGGKGKVVQLDLPGLRATVAVADGEKTISIQDMFPQTGPFANLPPPPPPPPPAMQRQERPAAGGGKPMPRGQQGFGGKGGGMQGRRGDQGGRRDERPRRGAPVSAGDSDPRGWVAAAKKEQAQRERAEALQRAQEDAHSRQPDKPLERRSPESQAAQASREALLATKPGQKVYVIPFAKSATLIRINADKELAVVQSGIFEMEIPLSDLEPILAPKEPAPAPKVEKKKHPAPQSSPAADAAQSPPAAQPPSSAAPEQAAQPPAASVGSAPSGTPSPGLKTETSPAADPASPPEA